MPDHVVHWLPMVERRNNSIRVRAFCCGAIAYKKTFTIVRREPRAFGIIAPAREGCGTVRYHDPFGKRSTLRSHKKAGARRAAPCP